MPRRPRIQLDQVPLHIVQRSHNCRCFGDEGEFEAVKYSTLTPLIPLIRRNLDENPTRLFLQFLEAVRQEIEMSSQKCYASSQQVSSTNLMVDPILFIN